MQNNKENEISQYNKKQSSTLKAMISGGCVLTEMSLAGIFMENLKMLKEEWK